MVLRHFPPESGVTSTHGPVPDWVVPRFTDQLYRPTRGGISFSGILYSFAAYNPEKATLATAIEISEAYLGMNKKEPSMKYQVQFSETNIWLCGSQGKRYALNVRTNAFQIEMLTAVEMYAISTALNEYHTLPLDERQLQVLAGFLNTSNIKPLIRGNALILKDGGYEIALPKTDSEIAAMKSVLERGVVRLAGGGTAVVYPVGDGQEVTFEVSGRTVWYHLHSGRITMLAYAMETVSHADIKECIEYVKSGPLPPYKHLRKLYETSVSCYEVLKTAEADLDNGEKFTVVKSSDALIVKGAVGVVAQRDLTGTVWSLKAPATPGTLLRFAYAVQAHFEMGNTNSSKLELIKTSLNDVYPDILFTEINARLAVMGDGIIIKIPSTSEEANKLREKSKAFGSLQFKDNGCSVTVTGTDAPVAYKVEVKCANDLCYRCWITKEGVTLVGCNEIPRSVLLAFTAAFDRTKHIINEGRLAQAAIAAYNLLHHTYVQ
jgi:hypothetical protein